MKKLILGIAVAAAVAGSMPAQARDTKLMMPLAAAMAANDAQARLGDTVKFYFGNQKAPGCRQD
jgi:anti-sigma-K factor RskA